LQKIKEMDKIPFILIEWLEKVGVRDSYIESLAIIILIFSVLLVSLISNFIAKKVILNVLKQVVKRTKSNWDDVLYEKKVFHNLSHIAPVIIIYYTADAFLINYPGWLSFVWSMVNIYMIVVIMLIISSFLGALNEIYSEMSYAKDRPIKGYLQVVNIFNYGIGSIIILAIFLDKDPSYFLTGLGAVAAVLMLVFKDSLLGLVAGIQLSANDMVRIGDWISMPAKNADGDVIEISLHTVKVQNWDRTITLIPSYSLVSESFINWRGMTESGGRRIKRAINIDMKTVKFLTHDDIEKLKKVHLLKDYIESKEIEIVKFNEEKGIDTSVKINGRRMTNIGTFRKYCELYLKNHPHVHKEMIMIVRQLHPTEIGIPLELYFFSKIIDWVNYEAIQSDVFDHLLAIISEFDLKVFQNPTELKISNIN